MTDVFYVLSDGTKGSFRAPTSNLEKALVMTRNQLMYGDDGVAYEYINFTKAEVIAA